MNVFSHYCLTFSANDCLFSLNEIQKVYFEQDIVFTLFWLQLQEQVMFESMLINNYSPRWRWIVQDEGLPGGGGGLRGGCGFPCFLEKKIAFLPCSPKISQDVPLNSRLLSSPVPRNSTACSLDPQKYSLMFPKIPNIFQFSSWWSVLVISFTSSFIVDKVIQPQQNACFVSGLVEYRITLCLLAEISVQSFCKSMDITCLSNFYLK